MEKSELMTAMIEKCRTMILQKPRTDPARPWCLRRPHLIWMCDDMDANAGSWSSGKLNRWIGFIQCAMIARGTIDLDDAKAMFDQEKMAFADPSEDMLDHLNPDVAFEVDLGGEG